MSDMGLETRALEPATIPGELLRTIFEAGPLGMALLGLNFQFLRVNARFCQMLGYCEAELLALNLWQITHPDDRPDNRSNDREWNDGPAQPLAEGTSVSASEKRFLQKDGQIARARLTLCLLHDADSAPSHYLSMFEAVSHSEAVSRSLDMETALADSESKFQSVVESAHEAIILIDEWGRVVSWNGGAQTLFGYGAAEMRGQSLDALLPARYRAAHGQSIEGLRLGAAPRLLGKTLELQGLRKDGAEFPLELSLSSWQQGERTFYSGVIRDISERKAVEAASRVAQQELERASAAKSDFLSRMSHELRTPLNAILGFAQLLELDALSDEQEDNVQQILKGGEHLLVLINEVLDIARIEAGHLSLSVEPVSLAHTLREVVAMLRPLAKASNVALRVDFAPLDALLVRADQGRLKQVLLNLVSNAIKYNREGGSVAIDCLPVARNSSTHEVPNKAPNTLRIRVRDTGKGLEAHEIERLFTPFERLRADETEVEGTGLGLALSKNLMSAMDGQIGVQSTPGRGSTFWIELPLVPAPDNFSRQDAASDADSASANSAAEAASPAPRTVLYIDDNAANTRLLERIAARRPGLQIIAAREGLQGIELARRDQPDLILLDIHLPDLRGNEVLSRLKNHPATARIPVVMLSADETPGSAERLLAQGADAYLAKPLVSNQFLSLLDELLSRSNALDSTPKIPETPASVR